MKQSAVAKDMLQFTATARVFDSEADCLTAISIFAISTYDTDYILIKTKELSNGIETLQRSRYFIE